MAISLLGGVEPSAALVGKSLGIAALAGLAMFFTRLYQARTRFRNMMKKHDIVRQITGSWGCICELETDVFAAHLASLVLVRPSDSRGKSPRLLPRRLVSMNSGHAIWTPTS